MTLDAKGRLTVPVHFKDSLMAAEQGKLVVCKGFERCLQLVPASLWPQVEAMLAEVDEDLRGAAIKRQIIGSAVDVTIDAAARVTLPPELREFAGLQRDVVFMGLGNHFELWDKTRRAADEERLLTGGDLRDGVSGFSMGRLKRVVAGA
jgi:MraZ protein